MDGFKLNAVEKVKGGQVLQFPSLKALARFLISVFRNKKI